MSEDDCEEKLVAEKMVLELVSVDAGDSCVN